MRMVAPDKGVREIDVTTERGTSRYRPDRGGIYNVENSNHAKQMQHEGFFQASLMGPAVKAGFDCKCGFAGWFSVCSRCGADNG